MSVQAVLLPVLVQVALTLALLVWTGLARVATIKRGETKVSSIALGQQNWPARVTQIGNSYNSQFQLPLLFYVLVILALMTRLTDLLFVVMSWLFVLARLGHCYVHVTSNNIVRRFRIFVAGVVILSLMWTIFAIRLLVGLS